ncbi:MAG: hypothetical protein AABY04_01375 [Candidatus Micrarchaeota archaeon]
MTGFESHRWLTSEFNPIFNSIVASLKGRRTYFNPWNGPPVATVDHDENEYIKSRLLSMHEELERIILSNCSTYEVIQWIMKTSEFIQGRGQYFWELSESFETQSMFSVLEYSTDKEGDQYMAKYAEKFKKYIVDLKEEREKIQKEVDELGRSINNLRSKKEVIETSVKELDKAMRDLEEKRQEREKEIEEEVKKKMSNVTKELKELEEKKKAREEEIEREIEKEKKNLEKVKKRRKTADFVDKIMAKIVR